MHLSAHFPAANAGPALQRARGALLISSKYRDGLSCIDALRSSGCARIVFPRLRNALEGIIVNTSGGLTGGDQFEVSAYAGPGSHLVLTSQASERAYRSLNDIALVRTSLKVDDGARLTWLPQEMLVFDGAALDRRLEVELAPTAEFLMAEPVVFGRTEMRETVRRATFLDRVCIRREGRPLFNDRVALTGNTPEALGQSATARGLEAMANVVLISPRAPALLEKVRGLLPDSAGASLLHSDTLVIRLLAQDGFLLRNTLCPVLETLSGASLPRSWRL